MDSPLAKGVIRDRSNNPSSHDPATDKRKKID